MRSSSRGLTNVALIRDYQRREAEAPPATTTPPTTTAAATPPLKAAEPRSLFERWEAPVLPEEEIEAWATRYRLCPKSGMSFIEYLIVRGVGSLH